MKPSSASPNATYCSAPSPYLWPTAAGESHFNFNFEFKLKLRSDILSVPLSAP